MRNRVRSRRPLRHSAIFNKELVWVIRVVVAADMAVVDTAGLVKCTRRLARIAKRNAKCLLNPGKTVRYIARIVFQSVRTKAVNLRLAGLT